MHNKESKSLGYHFYQPKLKAEESLWTILHFDVTIAETDVIKTVIFFLKLHTSIWLCYHAVTNSEAWYIGLLCYCCVVHWFYVASVSIINE